MFLLGDIRHHLGDLVQGLLCVGELLAQEGIASTQPHVAAFQRQEGDKEVNQILIHQTAVAKATV